MNFKALVLWFLLFPLNRNDVFLMVFHGKICVFLRFCISIIIIVLFFLIFFIQFLLIYFMLC